MLLDNEWVFDVTVNGDPFAEGMDIYAFNNPGLYQGLEHYTNTSRPLGPYLDSIKIEATAKSNSSYPASIAGVEVLQLFDNPMNATTPTSSSDGMYSCIPQADHIPAKYNHSFIYIIQLLHVCLINF